MSQTINRSVLKPEITLDDSDTEGGSGQHTPQREATHGDGALVRQHHPGPHYMIQKNAKALYRIQSQCRQTSKAGSKECECEVLLCPSPYVSKSHCEFFWKDGMCWIRDLGSTNGTFVNGKRLVRYRGTRLHFGDMIAIAAAYTEGGDWLTNVKDDTCYVFIFQEVQENQNVSSGSDEGLGQSQVGKCHDDEDTATASTILITDNDSDDQGFQLMGSLNQRAHELKTLVTMNM